MSKFSTTTSSPEVFTARTDRRKFLIYSGVGIVTTGLLLSGCSDDDAMADPNLQPASNLMAETKANGDIVLNWKDNSAGESGYRVERSTSPTGDFSKVGSDLAPNSTQFVDMAAGLPTAGALYYYRVTAFQGSKVSAASAVISSTGAMASVDLGSGDVGVLNYAYALEQLEAAFYTMVVEKNFYSGATDMEKRILEDIQKHEVAHRDFFKAAISTVAEPIPGLMVDFSSVDFSSRASVLGTAKVFENLGVAAYNGAGKLLKNAEYLVVAGKIVSVEARHAAVIEKLVNPQDAFVNFIKDGLDRAMMPSEVLAAASAFIVTQINAENLPTT